MFNKLKEKLKSWTTKNSEPEEDTKENLEKSPKKEKKKTLTKKKSSPKKTKSGKETKSQKTKDTQEETPITKKKRLSLFSRELTREKFEELFEELQLILLQHNVAYEAVEQIEQTLKENLIGKPEKEINLSSELRTAIENLLINPPNFIETIQTSKSKPYVILFAGINGAGKTTTIAKLAHLLKKNKFTVCLAAADTFRAAAIQQLEEHANKLKVPLIKKDYGADPAAVGFDAIKYAKKNKIDVVLIDTAGRMQNSDTLMKEIEKIARVTKPDMTILLAESTTGNDATTQAKIFNETIPITGTILSKADVDESGGTAISIAHITKKPILFLGTGQTYNDLEEFNKEKLIEKLDVQ
jgi:fused signal recognition particle receptor